MNHADSSRHPATLVVGLGASGLSVARHLAARGQAFEIADSRIAPPGMDAARAAWPGVPVHAGPFDEELFSRFERLVVSPGVAVAEAAIVAARDKGAEVLGDIELFARECGAPVIAITGSNGKSTVTSLVGVLAAASGAATRVGGNIGVPALDLLGDEQAELYVLELSSFQLETTRSLQAAGAVVLNISADHLDRYDSLEAYAAAKGVIYRGCRCCVVNRDDPLAQALAGSGCRTLSFGLDAPSGANEFGLVEDAGRAWLARGSHRLIAVDELRLTGSHNVANVLASLALLAAVGINTGQPVLDALRAYAGLPHRMETVAEVAGIRWINDSKGTNVGATRAAIAGLDTPVVLIAGGLGKGADFTELAAAADGRVREAILLGADREALARALADTVPVRLVDSLGQAVARAAEAALAGDSVLFSPACASFDMFRNFEHRGDCFRQLVREWLQCPR